MQVKIGDFILIPEKRCLLQNGQEIAVEPRVMDLLICLYRMRDEYVDHEVLLEQVWQGRFVSQSTVRSTVRKLRKVLGDQGDNAGQYIQSQNKQGYRLVCEVQVTKDAESTSELNTDTQQTVESAPDEPPQIPAASGPAKSARSRHGIFIPAFLLAAIALLAYVWLNQSGDSSTNESEPPLSQLLSDFPGQKQTLAVSDNGRYVAFTGRTGNEKGVQLYLLDRHKETVRKLTHRAHNAVFALFVEQDTALLYSDHQRDKTLITRVPLAPEVVWDENNARVYTIEQDIGPLISGRHEREILFPAASEGEDNFNLHALDLDSGNISRLTFTPGRYEYDYDAAISPDRTHLAVARFLSSGQNLLTVLNLADMQLVASQIMPEIITSLVWRNPEQLLILDEQGLYRLHLADNSLKEIMQNPGGNWHWMDSHDGKELILLNQTGRDRYLHYQQSLPLGLTAPMHLPATDDTLAIHYGPAQQQLIVRRTEETRTISLQDPATGKEQQLFTTEQTTLILDQAPRQNLLLLELGERLAVLDMASSRIQYVTSAAQFFSGGVFSADGDAVLFGELLDGQWRIRRFDLQSQQTTRLIKGYLSIRPYNEKYVAATPEEGELFILSEDLKSAIRLNRKMPIDNIMSWFVRQDKVIWSGYFGDSSFIDQLDLQTGEYQRQRRPFLQFHPQIDVSPDGSKVLYSITVPGQHEIRSLRLPE